MFRDVKEASGVVVSSKDGAAGTALRDPEARRGTGQPARRACSVSGEGPDNNKAVEVECKAIRFVIWIGVEKHFSEGLDKSVREGISMLSGRGGQTSLGRRRGIGSNWNREQDHPTRNFPSPQHNIQFFSLADDQGPAGSGGGSSCRHEAGGGEGSSPDLCC